MTEADAVIDLARRAGLPLSPWQERAVRAHWCDCHEPSVFGHQDPRCARTCVPRRGYDPQQAAGGIASYEAVNARVRPAPPAGMSPAEAAWFTRIRDLIRSRA
jgi:hypothetical protein